MHCTRWRRLLEQESRLSDEVASEGNDALTAGLDDQMGSEECRCDFHRQG